MLLITFSNIIEQQLKSFRELQSEGYINFGNLFALVSVEANYVHFRFQMKYLLQCFISNYYLCTRILVLIKCFIHTFIILCKSITWNRFSKSNTLFLFSDTSIGILIAVTFIQKNCIMCPKFEILYHRSISYIYSLPIPIYWRIFILYIYLLKTQISTTSPALQRP